MTPVDDPVAVTLKFGFLAVLYLFLLFVARSALRDLRRNPIADVLDPDQIEAEDRRAVAAPDLRAGVDPSLVVVAAMGYEPGAVLPIGEGATIGRSPTADITIDDAFASSAHARILSRGQFMYIEDMGSTNGTYLNGRRLRGPARLNLEDSVRIGDTEYRYEE